MRRHGRKPMSMTHGDFDYEYLERPWRLGAERVAALLPALLRGALRLDDVRPPRDQASGIRA